MTYCAVEKQIVWDTIVAEHCNGFIAIHAYVP